MLTLSEVEMSKKSQVKSVKNWRFRTTFGSWDVAHNYNYNYNHNKTATATATRANYNYNYHYTTLEVDGQIDRQIDRQTDKQTDSQPASQTDRQIDNGRDRETQREGDRERERVRVRVRASTATTTALHHAISRNCGWGDHCNHHNHSKKHSSNHLAVISGFALPSMRHNNSPLLWVSYLWNFRHHRVLYYWYIVGPWPTSIYSTHQSHSKPAVCRIEQVFQVPKPADGTKWRNTIQQPFEEKKTLAECVNRLRVDDHRNIREGSHASRQVHWRQHRTAAQVFIVEPIVQVRKISVVWNLVCRMLANTFLVIETREQVDHPENMARKAQQ